jgi:hypothetical protein
MFSHTLYPKATDQIPEIVMFENRAPTNPKLTLQTQPYWKRLSTILVTMYVRSNALHVLTRSAVCTFLALMFAVTAVAQPPAVIRFNELPPQPVNALTFNGVTFFFNVGGVPSTDATFRGFGPGSILFVQDPSLEGNAFGTLWILFDSPTGTPYVVFGLARSIFSSRLLRGALVDLFDTNFSFIKRTALPTYPYVTFSENLFNSPATTTRPIRLVRIVFPNATLATRFALDNLTYTAALGVGTIASKEAMVRASKEAMVRASLAAGVEPALGAPPLRPDVMQQLQNVEPSGERKPGPWTK